MNHAYLSLSHLHSQGLGDSPGRRKKQTKKPLRSHPVRTLWGRGRVVAQGLLLSVLTPTGSTVANVLSRCKPLCAKLF